jgi:hypothetical protein
MTLATSEPQRDCMVPEFSTACRPGFLRIRAPVPYRRDEAVFIF